MIPALLSNTEGLEMYWLQHGTLKGPLRNKLNGSGSKLALLHHKQDHSALLHQLGTVTGLLGLSSSSPARTNRQCWSDMIFE